MSYTGYMLTHQDPKSPIAEAYRILRKNIQFSGVDNPVKTIVVTSVGPDEGKTTVAMNLAFAYAQSGSRVLIMDADLRMPMVHNFFNLSNTHGMSKILAEQGYYSYDITTKVSENLNVLTSGPIVQNPSEFFNSNAMKNLINSAREDFDIVLIDAPPIEIITDVAILSTIADGTILVTAAGKVKRAAAQKAKELLERVHANILGVVLNKIPGTVEGEKHNKYYSKKSNESDKDQGDKKRKNFYLKDKAAHVIQRSISCYLRIYNNLRRR